MDDWLKRSRPLLGDNGVDKLAKMRVLLVGLGGVGGFALEALVRSGIGSLTLVDGDVFDVSNLNRQLLATVSVLGKFKAEVGAERAKSINPNISVIGISEKFTAETASKIFSDGKLTSAYRGKALASYDYIVDCIDSVRDKLELIVQAKRRNIPIISALGAANRLDVNFSVTDIYKTKYDPLARVMRKKLREQGIEAHKVVCSDSQCSGNSELSSVVFPPSVCGIMLAREVILDLLKL